MPAIFLLRVLDKIKKAIFWLTIIFIVSSILALTAGQSLPIEFIDDKTQSDFYLFIFAALPLSFILTLFGTIRKKNKKNKNWTIGILTFLAAGLCFFFLLSVMFSVGFGAWTNETILYRNKNDKNITVNQQRFDIGALGYGSRRIVKLAPFLKWFQTVEQIDTAKIDKTQWTLVNEQTGAPD